MAEFDFPIVFPIQISDFSIAMEIASCGKKGSVRVNVSMFEIPKPGFSLVKNVTFKAKFAEMKQQSSLNDGG
jgi:hypothetical protein